MNHTLDHSLNSFDHLINSTVASLEQQWFQLFEGRNEMLVLTVFSFVFHEFIYFARYLPFYLFDYIPFMRKYKIQQNKDNSSELIAKCLKGVILNQLFIQLPMTMFFHPVAQFFGMDIIAPFPRLQDVAIQVLLFMIFEDFYEYWGHRLLHFGWFYRNIHKMHHEFTAPFGITAEYAHPAETLILGIGTIGGPLLYVAVTRKLHIVTVFVWLAVRLLQTVDSHSGYDFPWSLHNFIPFWAGADFHDYHHMAFVNNYASSFRIWDYAFGTATSYQLWKSRQLSSSKKVEVERLYESLKAKSFGDVPEMTVEELSNDLDCGEDLVLVDVREPKEQEVSMIPGAITSKQFYDNQKNYKVKKIVAYCTIGARSGLFAKELRKDGYDAWNLAGSLLSWTYYNGKLVDKTGADTTKVHVYSKGWNYVNHGYTPTW